MMTLIVVIVVCAGLLLAVSLYRTARQQRTADRSFLRYAHKAGLSETERRLLMAVANRAGLKRSEVIFKKSDAFDIGAAELMRESRAGGSSANVLRDELYRLSYKLGFRDDVPSEDAESGRLAAGVDEVVEWLSLQRPALIARFELTDEVEAKQSAVSGQGTGGKKGKGVAYDWPVLDWASATVKEMVGSMLRMETELDVGVGQRVLVVVGPEGAVRRKKKTAVARSHRILQDIGVVQESSKLKASDDKQPRWSVAVKLTGLNGCNPGELLGVAGSAGHTAQKDSAVEQAEESAEKAVVAQGV